MKTIIQSTKKLIAFVCVVVCVCVSTKAQNIQFINNLNCNVTIMVEFMPPPNPPFCGGCTTVTLILGSGVTPYTVPATCSGSAIDACITVLDIGGWTPPGNHKSMNTCCMTPPTNQTGGPLPASCSSQPYTIVYPNFGNWTIF